MGAGIPTPPTWQLDEWRRQQEAARRFARPDVTAVGGMPALPPNTFPLDESTIGSQTMGTTDAALNAARHAALGGPMSISRRIALSRPGVTRQQQQILLEQNRTDYPTKIGAALTGSELMRGLVESRTPGDIARAAGGLALAAMPMPNFGRVAARTAEELALHAAEKEGMQLVEHYTPHELTDLLVNPASHQRGPIPGAERSRQAQHPHLYHDRSYFQAAGTEVEGGIAGHPVYHGTIPQAKIYDINADPLRMWADASAEAERQGIAGNAGTASIMEGMIRKKGFSAYRNNDVIASFEHVPVSRGPAILAGLDRPNRHAVDDLVHLSKGGGGRPTPTFGIISADVEGQTHGQLTERRAGLYKLLREDGYQPVPTRGRWFNPDTKLWGEEPGFLVPNITPQAAKQYGARFGQHSVLHSTGMYDLENQLLHPFEGFDVPKFGSTAAHTVLPGGHRLEMRFGAPQNRSLNRALDAVLEQRRPGVALPPNWQRAYHGTTGPGFDIPTVGGEGVHVGTPEQAHDIIAKRIPHGEAFISATDVSDPESMYVGVGNKVTETRHRVIPLQARLQKVAHIPKDPGWWDPSFMARELEKNGTLTRAEADHIYNVSDPLGRQGSRLESVKAGRALLHETLTGKGYTAISYPNSSEGVYGQLSHIVLNPERDLANALQYPNAARLMPTGMDTPPLLASHVAQLLQGGKGVPHDTVTELGYATAHLIGKGTEVVRPGPPAGSGAHYLQSVVEAYPQLKPYLTGPHATPGFADKLWKAASVHAGFVRSMPASSEMIRRAAESPASWYGAERPLLAGALPRDVAHRAIAIGSHLSAQNMPARESLQTWRILQGTELGLPLDKIPGIDTGMSATKRAAVQRVLNGERWSLAEGAGAAPKVSNYYLNRMGLLHVPTIDNHMALAYTGKQLKNLTTAQRHILAARVAADAESAGVPVADFQAAVWMHQTGYATGFGQKGASLVDWHKLNLASGEFDFLFHKYPSLRGLAADGEAQISEMALDDVQWLLGLEDFSNNQALRKRLVTLTGEPPAR